MAAGCGGDHGTLSPESGPARDIARLWWVMMIVAWVGLSVVVALLLLAWARRRRDAGEAGERAGWAVVLTTGLALPILVVTALFVVADLVVIRVTEAPAAGSTSMTVRVIGHQWWWEFRYPGHAAVTANEMHIPVGTRVEVVATTADVIHSFWVPPLNRKIDTIPGRENRILLEADRPGRYLGFCGEFCGLQHAHMGMYVIADPRADFDRWLANESAPARTPSTAAERRGYRLVVGGSCSTCHRIAGTTAEAEVGPDLTHVAERGHIAGLAIANTPDGLARWIAHDQEVKPGNQMPQFPLPDADMRDVVAYLESLR